MNIINVITKIIITIKNKATTSFLKKYITPLITKISTSHKSSTESKEDT